MFFAASGASTSEITNANVVPSSAVSKVTIAAWIDSSRMLQSGGNISPTIRTRLWNPETSSDGAISVVRHAETYSAATPAAATDQIAVLRDERAGAGARRPARA